MFVIKIINNIDNINYHESNHRHLYWYKNYYDNKDRITFTNNSYGLWTKFTYDKNEIIVTTSMGIKRIHKIEN